MQYAKSILLPFFLIKRKKLNQLLSDKCQKTFLLKQQTKNLVNELVLY